MSASSGGANGFITDSKNHHCISLSGFAHADLRGANGAIETPS
jgi:hypothetical protein